jgi:hypothetical protein
MRTVEECHCLDVYRLRRKGALDPGKRARINFGQMATLHFVAADDHLEILFLETPYVKTTERSYLELERTLTSFGAERVQFLCPRCFKPKAKLYLPPGRRPVQVSHLPQPLLSKQTKRSLRALRTRCRTNSAQSASS